MLFLLIFSLDKYSSAADLLLNRKAVWRSRVSFEMEKVKLYRFLHCVVFSIIFEHQRISTCSECKKENKIEVVSLVKSG